MYIYRVYVLFDFGALCYCVRPPSRSYSTCTRRRTRIVLRRPQLDVCYCKEASGLSARKTSSLRCPSKSVS